MSSLTVQGIPPCLQGELHTPFVFTARKESTRVPSVEKHPKTIMDMNPFSFAKRTAYNTWGEETNTQKNGKGKE
jgi:hypothetical protein